MSAAENDFLDLPGRAVHRFALDMAQLGLARVGEELLAMLESGVWREFKDGLGIYKFLPGEFDYFLTQQGVDRDHVMQSVRDVHVKARLEAAMDERRTGESGYRRSIEEARASNPKRPGQPMLPYGYGKREANTLVREGVLPESRRRLALGSAVRRFTATGGKTTLSAAKAAPMIERLFRSAARLSDDELSKLVERLRAELRRRRK